MLSWRQTILQSYSDQNSIVQHKIRHTGQWNRIENGDVISHTCSQSTTKEARVFNEENTVSSLSGAGKTGQLHVERMRSDVSSYHVQ